MEDLRPGGAADATCRILASAAWPGIDLTLTEHDGRAEGRTEATRTDTILVLHAGRAQVAMHDGAVEFGPHALSAGAWIFLPAGAAYDWSIEGRSQILRIALDPRFMREACECERRISQISSETPLLLEMRPLLERTTPALPCVCRMLLDVSPLGAGAPCVTAALALSAACLSLAEMRCAPEERSVPAAGGLAPYIVRRVIDFMCENVARDLTLTDVARVAGLSPFHFARAFKASNGQPPMSFLRGLRIDKARELLMHGDRKLGEIARICGFSSPSAFSAAFAQVTGKAPGAYRRLYRAA